MSKDVVLLISTAEKNGEIYLMSTYLLSSFTGITELTYIDFYLYAVEKIS